MAPQRTLSAAAALVLSISLVPGYALKPSEYGTYPLFPSPSSAAENNGANFGYYDTDDHLPFEERAAAWRKYQQDRYESQTPAQRASALDEDGRTKLLATVSRGSIAFFFFVLMWRSVHHYEMADASFRGIQRLLIVVPTVGLFIGNMAGCVASITSPSHSAKKRMKAILNLNKLVELLLFVYNVVRLTIFPSKFVQREIYVGRTLSNFIFMVQCQLFTRVTWGAAQIKQEAALASGTEWTSERGYEDEGLYSGSSAGEDYRQYGYEYTPYGQQTRPFGQDQYK